MAFGVRVMARPRSAHMGAQVALADRARRGRADLCDRHDRYGTASSSRSRRQGADRARAAARYAAEAAGLGMGAAPPRSSAVSWS
jgi:hypothetical protein